MLFLKQSTAAQSVKLGPFVDDTDGATAETGLTIANTDIRLSANGGNMFAKTSGGGTHDENGWYTITLDATDTATVGSLQVSCKVAGALAAFMEFTVLEEEVYDDLFGSGAVGYLKPVTAGRDVDVTAGGAVGIDWGNIENPTTAVDLSGTDIQLVDTTTTNTDMRGTDSAATAADLLDKVGAVNEAAAAGDPSATESVMQYVKQIVNILIGTAGIAAFPAEAAPGNAVSLAEVIRAIHVDVTGLNGDAMRGTDNGATAAALATAQTDLDTITGAAGAIIDDSAANDATISDAVWDEPRTDHVTQGTYGEQMNAVQSGTVDNTAFTATTTILESDDITEATADHYIGRTIIFVTGANQYQATDITDYALNGGRGRFTYTALTGAPADNDTFIIV